MEYNNMELEEGEFMEDVVVLGFLGIEVIFYKFVFFLFLFDCYYMLICGIFCFIWFMVLEVYCILYMNFRVY